LGYLKLTTWLYRNAKRKMEIKMEITGLKRCHADGRKEERTWEEGEEEEELHEDRQALLLDDAVREGE
jgi:hypothetical protein